MSGFENGKKLSERKLLLVLNVRSALSLTNASFCTAKKENSGGQFVRPNKRPRKQRKQ